MTDAFTITHKAKHLLSHVLAAAGARRWPEVSRGDSGETKTGFYADFGLAGPTTDEELGGLSDDMARLLFDFSHFHPLDLSPEQALAEFGRHPWKRRQIEAIAETSGSIQCYDLDGHLDLCDCALKDPAELRIVHPEKFILRGAQPVVWTHRGRDEFFLRISGELIPTPVPCGCCRW